MKHQRLATLALVTAALAGSLLITQRATAQITVTTERIGTNPSTTGTFVFTTLPSNSSTDLANGKTFVVLAGTPNANGPISNLTNGPAQTNADSVSESFFAIGNVPDGTERIRIQIDLETVQSITQINSYSWHANARAPQVYKVYGAASPTNSTPDFTAAPFQDATALGALGYVMIADVKTAQNSGGQYGASIAGTLGEYRYLLFDLAPVSATTPRPTFFGEIDIYGTPAGGNFPLTITPAIQPATGFDLAWQSRAAKVYQLRTSTDMGAAIQDWELIAGNISATPPKNTFNVPQAGPQRFYAVEETSAPPLFQANFEANDGGFEAVTATGSSWAHGTPTSGSAATPNPGGFVSAGNGDSAKCWGTNIGNPGFYVPPTTTRLRSPVINLTSVAGARLSFAQAIDSREGEDSAVVNLISATTDTIIASAIHTSIDSDNNNTKWSTVQAINLAAGIGQQVRIEWVFTGQTATDFMGWYIDDVIVTETAL